MAEHEMPCNIVTFKIQKGVMTIYSYGNRILSQNIITNLRMFQIMTILMTE
jgi:hypothetical protein